MLTSTFWLAVLERALKSTAQALISTWAVSSFDVLHVNWKAALGLALGAGVMSVLTSLAGLPAIPAPPPAVLAARAAQAVQPEPDAPATQPIPDIGTGHHEAP
jgi:hypothetical protein